MSKTIANFLYFLILMVPTSYFQLGILGEEQKPCPADAKSEIICPASTGNYSTKNEV